MGSKKKYDNVVHPTVKRVNSHLHAPLPHAGSLTIQKHNLFVIIIVIFASRVPPVRLFHALKDCVSFLSFSLHFK